MNVSVIPIIVTVYQIDKLLKLEFDCSFFSHFSLLTVYFIGINRLNDLKLQIYCILKCFT